MAAYPTRSDFEGSNVVDGIGMLWTDSAEDGVVRGECEEDKGPACEDGDSDSVW
jgi:hypothetical protein